MGPELLLLRAAPFGAFLLLLRVLFISLGSPIKAFPGPFLARFTDLWRLLDYWRCTQIQTHRRLHDKLGTAVRIGPNIISLSDPSVLKTVYSTHGEFVKSNFYEVGDAISDGQRLQTIFSTRDPAFHTKYMRPYSKYFSMRAILQKEHLVDKVVVALCQQLENRYVDGPDAGNTARLADWIEYCAWDFDWEMTFSQDMGFLKSGTDVKNLIHTGESIMRYLGCIGQVPWLDRLLGKNPRCPIKFATFNNVALYSFQCMKERQEKKGREECGDFLDNFFRAQRQFPDIVSDNEIISYLMMNILAGADTTAIVQKAITYYILANPEVLRKLRAELDAAGLSFPPKYEQTKDLPYLNAVIKEGMRMHPVIGGILERVVPGTGLTLPDGRFIAPGTKVGFNPWVIARNTAIFGIDADLFRPERWLPSEYESREAYEARVARMKDANLTFGAGKRVCIGQHMATVEIHKITSTLFSRYDMYLDPTWKQWSPRWWWFTFIDDINIKIQRRPMAEPL